MRSKEEMIAYALEVDPELLPFLPELLADLDELGSDAEQLCDVIEALQLQPTARILDAGCGKGSTSFAIASRLGLCVHGIDLFAPFVEACQREARKRGLEALCTFACADIQAEVGAMEPFDVVIYAALGDVLGPLDQTMKLIRQFVRPGGFVIINDDYRKEGTYVGEKAHEGYDNYVCYDETIKRLTAHGDVLVREVEEAHDEMVEDNEEVNAHIRRRAEAIATRHPEWKDALEAFVAEQQASCDYMEDQLVAMIWVLQRTAAQID
jgi:cyclopropane fatty-acyl-phospholipid synthase-like methyltransferase